MYQSCYIVHVSIMLYCACINHVILYMYQSCLFTRINTVSGNASSTRYRIPPPAIAFNVHYCNG